MPDGISFRKRISCLGNSKGKPGSIMYKAMKEVGAILAEKRIDISTGAYNGPGMKAPMEGAKNRNELSVRMGFPFLNRPVNKFVSWKMDCHKLAKSIIFPKGIIFPGINVPFLGFGIRLVGLLSADGFTIAAGGGIGTFLEFIAIIFFNTKIWGKTWFKKYYDKKRVVILYPPKAKGIKCWDKNMIQQLIDWKFLDKDLIPLMKIAKTPKEAVAWVLGE